MNHGTIRVIILTLIWAVTQIFGQFTQIVNADENPDVNDDPSGDRYFPTDEADSVLYAKHLRAMGEPSLLVPSKDLNVETYRFLYVPTFSKPIAYRVYADGEHYKLRITRLSGQGGGDSGTVELTGEIALDPIQIEAIRNTLDNPELRSPISKLQADAFAVMDGAQWVLEITRDGGHSLIAVQSPDALVDSDPKFQTQRKKFAAEHGIEVPDLRAFVHACLMFVDLAQVQLPEP